ncbi:reverse transcriptase domain-containing protein [Tanacetum coccineum]
MRTRNSYYPNNSPVTIPRRRNRRRAPNIVEPELRTIVEVAPMADNRTMEELLQAPTEGYGEAIVIPEILAENFEIKTNLLQLVQAKKFHDFEKDNLHTHIANFKRMIATLKYRDVPNDVIKLMLFPYSLEGAARIWYEKEPPNSILTWDDLTFSEAWERFKEMLRACPHHGFTELTQIDTFYNGLNENDQDSLNAAAGGNLLSKTTREALNIIENKSKVRYSRSKSNVSRVNTTSRESSSKTDDRIDKLADQISTLVEIVTKKVVTPATVKAVEESCVICGDAHAYYNCNATNRNQSSVCAATEWSMSTALADIGASIKFLCLLSIWKKLSLPELTPTRMTLELADRSITHPKGVTEDVFDKVGKFHFPTNFVVVDFDADPRVYLILGRSFLRTGQVLVFSNNSTGGNPTLTFEPIISDSSLFLTPFEGSDLILEEIEAYLKDDSISLEIDHADFDLEGDLFSHRLRLVMLFLEEFADELALLEPFPPGIGDDDFDPEGDILLLENITDEDVPKDNVKIYSNPLFEFDDEYISSEVNTLFNEELEDIKSNKSCFSNLDDPDLSVTPLSDTNEDECFDPRGDIHDPRSLKDEPDNDDLMTEDKVFNLGI